MGICCVTWFMHDQNSVQYYKYCILEDINYQNSEEALVRIRSFN